MKIASIIRPSWSRTQTPNRIRYYNGDYMVEVFSHGAYLYKLHPFARIGRFETVDAAIAEHDEIKVCA